MLEMVAFASTLHAYTLAEVIRTQASAAGSEPSDMRENLTGFCVSFTRSSTSGQRYFSNAKRDTRSCSSKDSILLFMTSVSLECDSGRIGARTFGAEDYILWPPAGDEKRGLLDIQAVVEDILELRAVHVLTLVFYIMTVKADDRLFK